MKLTDHIRDCHTGEIMCGGLSFGDVLERHKKWVLGKSDGVRANLRGAYLSGLDLSGIDLYGANLRGANLRYASLRGANLRDAELRYANLCYTDLRGAHLGGADLRDANLSGADLRGIYLNGVPFIEDIHQAVYAAASQEGCLDMSSWHCGTKHCRAGWVVTLAGEAGAAMEFCLGTPTAAALIYIKSDPSLDKIPDFYNMDNDASLADMKRLAELEAAEPKG